MGNFWPIANSRIKWSLAFIEHLQAEASNKRIINHEESLIEAPGQWFALYLFIQFLFDRSGVKDCDEK